MKQAPPETSAILSSNLATALIESILVQEIAPPESLAVLFLKIIYMIYI